MLEMMKDQKFAQMAFVVRDVEKAKTEFSRLFGFKEVPPTCDLGPVETAKTEYKGRPAPEIECKIAYFDFENIQIELMEPNEVPSAWRDWLDAHGESLHHVSFFVTSTRERIRELEEKGMELVQQGDFADGSGCYAYLDTKGKLPCLIELLENY